MQPRPLRYELLELLAQGGLGDVYSARSAERAELVAFKRLRLPDDPASAERLKRLFEAEYHTLKQLQHPSIIEVYDYGIDAELGPYYTMELLTGRDLRELAPVPWREACRLLMDVASSLAVVHSRRLLHRDVTARNVRRTSDGRAKLLDFGALTEIGLIPSTIGTPPFVAPEAVHQQPLDARADLYALGALAYYMLTGRHAFPARSFRQLRELWRSRPRSVRSADPEIPESLNTLVMSLLEADMLARPQSAAEVMARLGAIADLALNEDAAVAHAYLTTPKLVARDAAVLRVRKQLIRALRGRGGSVLIRGAAGTGRSRMLHACVLEAQLAGAIVVRADAGDAGAPFAVARRLVQRLLQREPDLRETVLELQLEHMLSAAAKTDDAAPSPKRATVIANLTQLLLRASAGHVITIAVDDLHRIDEPSLALLAGVASQAPEQRIVLALSIESDAVSESSLAIELLSETAHVIELAPLEPQDTRALLASVFGVIPYLDLLAALIHRACAGRPREIMDVAQRLVDTRIARYEGGRWSLTDDAGEISRCVERSDDVQARLTRLSPRALELLELMALDRDDRLTEVDLTALCGKEDGASLRDALSELLRERWLVRAEDGYRYARASEQRGVAERLSPAARRRLHLGIAERLGAQRRDPIYEVYHLVHGGQAARAGDAMKRYLHVADSHPNRIRAAIELETVEALVDTGTTEGWPLPLLTQYRTQVMLLAAASGAWERVLPLAQVTLQALSDYCGLGDYHALDGAAADTRLRQAMSAAQARFDSSPLVPHPLPPALALRALAKVSTVAAVSANWMAEPGAFAGIPSLTPLVPLAPALGLVERMIQAFRAFTQGQDWAGLDELKQLYLDIRSMPEQQLDVRTRYTLELAALSTVCNRSARDAASTTLAHCEALAPTQPDQAQNYRMLYHMAAGDLAAAEAARQACELLTLRVGATNDTRLTRLQASAFLYPLADDWIGLQRTVEGIDVIVERKPGWRYTRDLARAHERRCRGKTEEALALVERSLADLPEGNYAWCPTAEAHVLLLTQTDRCEEALARGNAYAERAQRLDTPTAWLELAIAQCLARMERHSEAEQRWQAALSMLSRRDIGGIRLGYAHEIGARIALRRGDRVAFHARAADCARIYMRGSNPALAAKHKRLLDEAVSTGSVDAACAIDDATEDTLASGLVSMRRALAQCGDDRQCAARALALLCEHTGAPDGILFGIRGARLQPLGDAGALPDGMLALVEAYLSAEIEGSVETNTTQVDSADPASCGFFDTAQGSYQPLLLRTVDREGEFIVGIAMLRADARALRAASRDFVRNLSEALLAVQAVEGVRVAA